MLSTVMFECVTVPSTLPRGCFYYNPYIFAVIIKIQIPCVATVREYGLYLGEEVKFECPRIRCGSERVKRADHLTAGAACFSKTSEVVFCLFFIVSMLVRGAEIRG